MLQSYSLYLSVNTIRLTTHTILLFLSTSYSVLVDLLTCPNNFNHRIQSYYLALSNICLVIGFSIRRSKEKVANPDTAELVFDSREKCVEFLDDLLRHKMFHRAKKIPVICRDKLTRLIIKK